MQFLSGTRLFLASHALLLILPAMVSAQSVQPSDTSRTTPSPSDIVWTVAQAEHIAGLADIKAHRKGTLTLTGDELIFAGKAGRAAIPRNSITAVSAGNQRVEMWGMTGRILRMAIPDNGGLAVAAVAHHRVDMLTVEYHGKNGGARSAVFFLGANQATLALEKFAIAAKAAHETVTYACQSTLTEPGSVLVAAPNWEGAQVPAVYQALVYEHLIDRFRKAEHVSKTYREGEALPSGMCPQYTVQLTVTGFTEGSSVKRAMLGPVGMFVGTTQMVFDAKLDDRSGVIDIKEQVKTTVRGETESTNVADNIAKSLVKKYEKAMKAAEKKASKQGDVQKA